MNTKWTSTTVPSGEQSALGDQFVVLLLHGKNSFGDKIYSYLKITLNNLARLKSAIKSDGGFNPSDFGEVLSAGRGEPSESVRAEMKSMYQVVDSAKSGSKPATPVAPPAEKKAWDEY